MLIIITRKIYIINDLRVNILININIFNFKKYNINLNKNFFILITYFNFLIQIKIVFKNIKINRILRI